MEGIRKGTDVKGSNKREQRIRIKGRNRGEEKGVERNGENGAKGEKNKEKEKKVTKGKLYD